MLQLGAPSALNEIAEPFAYGAVDLRGRTKPELTTGLDFRWVDDATREPELEDAGSFSRQ